MKKEISSKKSKMLKLNKNSLETVLAVLPITGNIGEVEYIENSVLIVSGIVLLGLYAYNN